MGLGSELALAGLGLALTRPGLHQLIETVMADHAVQLELVEAELLLGLLEALLVEVG